MIAELSFQGFEGSLYSRPAGGAAVSTAGAGLPC